jgi:hypothetical protein
MRLVQEINRYAIDFCFEGRTVEQKCKIHVPVEVGHSIRLTGSSFRMAVQLANTCTLPNLKISD